MTGLYPCGHCKGCANMIKSKEFSNAAGDRTYSFRHFIICSTRGSAHVENCTLASQHMNYEYALENMSDIEKGRTTEDPSLLKTIPRHFFQYHNSNSSLLKVKGIDVIQLGSRGGDLAKNLAKLECKWIYSLLYWFVLLAGSSGTQREHLRTVHCGSKSPVHNRQDVIEGNMNAAKYRDNLNENLFQSALDLRLG
ncbi:unnamed protein product [Ranitomeya imitator]|uniref:Uncharacterized protein n=1 Tax=Ranitomeya imitator TaxID=111125 RepID=A0ABN9L094_9NEOB|nr:unnamed protein product [Ranitomeya imitator]